MDVLFVAGFGPISPDIARSRALYLDTLGLPLTTDDGLYHHTEALAGAKAFAVWPLAQAAQSCFGSDAWPEGIPAPQAWLEFDVADLPAATAELTAKGYDLLVAERTEPWGQSVSRFLSPEGILVAVTTTPWMRDAAPAETDQPSSGDNPVPGTGAFGDETQVATLDGAGTPGSAPAV